MPGILLFTELIIPLGSIGSHRRPCMLSFVAFGVVAVWHSSYALAQPARISTARSTRSHLITSCGNAGRMLDMDMLS